MLIKLLTLIIDDKTFALDITNIERVIPSVEITILPELPEYLHGVINYQGNIIPVINNRKLFLLDHKEIELTDMFIVVLSNSKYLCLISDSTDEIISCEDTEIVSTQNISQNITLSKGMLKKDGKIVIIYDIDKFIGLEEYELIEKRS